MPKRTLSGRGRITVAAPLAEVWPMLLDPDTLAAVIPGAEHVRRTSPGRFVARIAFGVGFARGRYEAELTVTGSSPPHTLDLEGQSVGLLGGGRASGHVALTALAPNRTALAWRYQGEVSGPVAVLGRGLHQVAGDLFVRRVFSALAKRAAAVRRGVA